jgi:predicted TIM-barrel fold metal-dependent hydrolase
MRTPPARLLYDPGVREGAACVASLGLVLDTWVYHHQLPDIADFADALPNAPLVLDHVGGPVRVGPYKDRTDTVYDQWLNGIKAVAQRQNVVVKVGGLGMHLLGFGFESRQRAPSSEDLAAAWRPFVEPCIDLFGPDRVMFESNFPVDSLSGSYPVVWNACKRLVSGCSAPEKAAMFHENAARIYSLNLNH